jgi:hypothetical protein
MVSTLDIEVHLTALYIDKHEDIQGQVKANAKPG